jgi:hypothetical protein
MEYLDCGIELDGMICPKDVGPNRGRAPGPAAAATRDEHGRDFKMLLWLLRGMHCLACNIIGPSGMHCLTNAI